MNNNSNSEKVTKSCPIPYADAEETSEFHLESLYHCNNDLKTLILDYLICEGYADASACFQSETFISSPNGASKHCPAFSQHQQRTQIISQYLQERQKIRELILDSQFRNTIEFIANVWPRFFEKNPSFLYQLRYLEVVQALRHSGVQTALQMAQDYFSPIVCRQKRNLEAMHWIENSMVELLRQGDPVSKDPSSDQEPAPPSKPSVLFQEADPLGTAHLDMTATSLNRALVEFFLSEAATGSSDDSHMYNSGVGGTGPGHSPGNPKKMSRSVQALPLLTSLISKVLYLNYLGSGDTNDSST